MSRRTERCPLCGGAPELDVDPCMGQIHFANCRDCFECDPDDRYCIQGTGPTDDDAIVDWLEQATELAEKIGEEEIEDAAARADHIYDLARDARMFGEDR